MKIFTIGFTKKSAREFFTKLKDAGVRCLIDVRLNNTSQLSGFAKKEDLEYFLKELGGIEYMHVPILAPTQDLLDAFKKQKGSWKEYEAGFLKLMSERRIEEQLDPKMFENSCLLCSEDLPAHCHRRLVCEYLRDKWGSLEIDHLI
jgi:uncharacterized protein (DUF488 family)